MQLNEIRTLLEEQIRKGNRDKIVLFPYGNVGIQIKKIMEDYYSMVPMHILDNHLCNYNSSVKPLDFLKEIPQKDYVVLLSTENLTIYEEVKKSVLAYISADALLELPSMAPGVFRSTPTKCGKYSYGPLCNHYGVESIGSFCSIGIDCDAVVNHAMSYISTSPFLYTGSEHENIFAPWEQQKDAPYYFPGVTPKGKAEKHDKVVIGNDVWFGRNVLITNGAKIGNGVIAGAGAVITKDVPDYAVVVGVPARIMRFRYTPEQIEALNRIQWWDWSDDEIRERFDDFYLPIEEFIKKYDV